MDDLSLYADGGVVGPNPSAIGGTYAWCIVENDARVLGDAHFMSAAVARVQGGVTNNQSEMMALLKGLEQMPNGWSGTVYSDSIVTLGRLFRGYKWSNLPMWLHQRYRAQVARLNWASITHVHLDGHPTRAQLASGIGKNGNPVSEHQMWCDQMCTKMAGIIKGLAPDNVPPTCRLKTDE